LGHCWNNLDTLIKTIENNNKMLSNIKAFYITTNDQNVLNYFDKLNCDKIKCKKFADNQGHQTSCFNAIISGMKMLIENDDDKGNDDDIVIFSHEDVYVNNIDLFNNSINKFKKGVDIVCRKYEGTKKGEALDYYMNDGFLIKRNKVKEIFENTNMMTTDDINKSFCENEFTKIISKYNVFSIPYHSHSTHRDSELGFYHILNYDIGDIPFWDKSNINSLYML